MRCRHKLIIDPTSRTRCEHQCRTAPHFHNNSAASLEEARRQPNGHRDTGAGLLFSDGHEVVHRDAADTSVGSWISRRKDKSLVARGSSTIEVDRCASFFLSLSEHQGSSGRADAVVTLRSYADGSDVTDTKN